VAFSAAHWLAERAAQPNREDRREQVLLPRRALGRAWLDEHFDRWWEWARRV
jgi:hypothetical protein